MNQVKAQPLAGRKHIGIVANHMLSVYQFRLGLIHRLQKEGYQVTVLAPMDAFAYLLLREGVHLQPLPFSTYSVNPLKDLSALWRLWRMYRKLRLDFIFHYTIKPNTFGTIAAWLSNIPSIAIVTGTGMLFSEKKSLTRHLMQSLYRHTTSLTKEVWFLNTHDSHSFLQNNMITRDKIRLIPGEGIDASFYSPRPKTEVTPGITFLFIGRLIAEKGIRIYVEAARRIKQKQPDAQFRIIGYPERHHPSAIHMDEIESWVKEGIVQYLGGTTDTRPHLANCDVFVLPSYFGEGLNRSLLEAAAMAKPVVTTDRPGCRETVKPGRTGLVVPEQDTNALAEAMMALLKLSSVDRVIMGELGREHVQRQYQVEMIHSVYLETLEHHFSMVPQNATVLKERDYMSKRRN